MQAFTRSGEAGELLFLLNLSRTARTIELDKHCRSALTGSLHSGLLELEPCGVEVLEIVS
ncbi:Beta-galactosidase C-terminal domain [Paenibacillus sp. S150]|uniref:Beta-galactosidase C-terminal domain n=1 Tax=Paenibacillus sp. S150 TaxID=2749826 RepID=UPI001C586CD2|nr:Beta-galactosidase C-terminal domain [Paenibacillus sp. S150]MBW4082391.1 Beta-galactosidase C-terminal domain [Paenibacillus sp. S150]